MTNDEYLKGCERTGKFAALSVSIEAKEESLQKIERMKESGRPICLQLRQGAISNEDISMYVMVEVTSEILDLVIDIVTLDLNGFRADRDAL